ncbi:phosphoadenosine phosphosulfate reductase domain-containing protein [Calidifontibacillus erzurumensis]|uniref:phosphoadenosine phosphosulfate reductase domain-containing protein n=1 Tax=Calidifontibacillus erzurumensis TaxID=2741433 RepID=UPI0035B517DF
MSFIDDFEFQVETSVPNTKKVDLFPLEEYDHILISLSSGKDSMACLLYLMEIGAPTEKMEICHQSVDGKEDTHAELMDWGTVESYAEAVGDLFGIPVSFQWRARGFYGELMRKDSLSGDVYYLDNGKIHYLPTKNGKPNTRLKFPAMSSDLRVRWCSAYLKIDVFRRVLNNHPKYQGTVENPKKILVITGERREESYNRSKYNETEYHPSHSQKRIVHAWRPIIDWTEQMVWDIFERWKIRPYVAYYLGFNRTSCLGCIFSTPDLWAIVREIAPERFRRLVELEKELNHTIDIHISLEQKANMGSLKRLPKDPRVLEWIDMAFTKAYTKNDLIMEKFELPAGAFHGGEGGAL